jgi:hypothetical protein
VGIGVDTVAFHVAAAAFGPTPAFPRFRCDAVRHGRSARPPASCGGRPSIWWSSLTRPVPSGVVAPGEHRAGRPHWSGLAASSYSSRRPGTLKTAWSRDCHGRSVGVRRHAERSREVVGVATGGLRPVRIKDAHDAEQPTVRRWRPESAAPPPTRSPIGAGGCRTPSGQERAELARRRSAELELEILKCHGGFSRRRKAPATGCGARHGQVVAGRGVEVDHVTLYRWVRRAKIFISASEKAHGMTRLGNRQDRPHACPGLLGFGLRSDAGLGLGYSRELN